MHVHVCNRFCDSFHDEFHVKFQEQEFQFACDLRDKLSELCSFKFQKWTYFIKWVCWTVLLCMLFLITVKTFFSDHTALITEFHTCSFIHMILIMKSHICSLIHAVLITQSHTHKTHSFYSQQLWTCITCTSLN